MQRQTAIGGVKRAVRATRFKKLLFVLLLTFRFGIQNEFPSLFGQQADKRKIISTETIGRFPFIVLFVGPLECDLKEGRFAIFGLIFEDGGSDAAKSERLHGLVGIGLFRHSERGNKTK
jgi:hypothetical protein